MAERASRLGTDPLAFAAPIAGPRALGDRHGAVGGGAQQDRRRQSEGRADPRTAGRSTITASPPPTPNAALSGTLLPIGGAKGSALALIVEILCGALAGSQFGWEASGFMDAKGGPPKLGQFLIALDPAHFAGAGFASRMTELVDAIAADGARLPGDRRLACRERAAREGLSIASDLFAQIQALAD